MISSKGRARPAERGYVAEGCPGSALLLTVDTANQGQPPAAKWLKFAGGRAPATAQGLATRSEPPQVSSLPVAQVRWHRTADRSGISVTETVYRHEIGPALTKGATASPVRQPLWPGARRPAPSSPPCRAS